MGLKDSDDHDAASFDDGSKSVSCSICLEVVADNGDRSWAKLQCGHQFHLDCIGSAFNVKGSMQCPNCRKIEKGQWLYANGCRTLPEFTMDDWTHEEDVYDLSYSEMPFGVHWCPFGQIARLPTTFEEAELTPAAYHDPLGQHALYAEHSGVSSAAHPCPYVTYLGPMPPSSSSSNGSMPDAASVNNHWNGPSVQSEVPGSYPFPAIDLHYHNWEHHSPPFSASRSRPGGSDPPSVAHTVQRSARPNNDLLRSGSFLHPFVVGHSSGARAVNSVATSLISPYPGSNARTRDRVQALQTYYQQQRPSYPVSSRAHIISANSRPLNHRGMTPMATASDQLGGFYFFPAGSSSHSFQELESFSSTRLHLWDRDHLPGLLSHVDRDLAREGLRAAHGGSEAGTRHGSFSQRHGFDRVESNNRT